MANVSSVRDRTPGRASAELSQLIRNVLTVASAPLLFALRLWASVCLALYVAFWLQLDNADWAGTTAFIVCQPQLGASLRKGWYRMIGTLIGAVMVVVITALFIQDRVAFLGTLALWGAVCALAATVLRNFASYAAALAGYTTAIIAADTLGATGGPSPDVFMLAVMRASEISVGIVSAGIVLAGTDLGRAPRQLATLVAALAAEIAGRFTDMLAHAGAELPPTRPVRRELTRRTVALDPIIDLAIGESSRLRYHSPILQTAQHGLFTALDGWRGVATRLEQLRPDAARQEIETILQALPLQLRSPLEVGAPARWTNDPLGLERTCEGAARALLALPAGTPSLRLLADQTAKLLTGFAHVFAGLALLVDAPGRPPQRGRGFKLSVPDFLPAQISAIRAFLAIGAVELLWVVTAWPSGAVAILFTAVLVLLFSPKGDASYAAAFTFTIGIIIGISFTATLKFAVLPNFDSFAGLSAVIGLCMVPVGFGLASSRQPVVLSMLTAVGIGFIPLLQPANPITYDTSQYYNTALALFAGSCAASLAFALIPPPSPALRIRRLLTFALRDLRGCVVAPRLPEPAHWESRMYGRLTAMPEQTEPLQLAELLATLSVGCEVIRLRHMASALPLGPELDSALDALAQGNSFAARMWLARLDERLASLAGVEAQLSIALQARASILAISGALARHSGYFDSGANA